jgi:hypothetical protein
VFVELTKKLTLACKIDNKGEVTWTKDGKAFTDAGVYSAGKYDQGTDSQTSTLIFENTAKANEGTYVCTYESLSATFVVDTFGRSTVGNVNPHTSHYLIQ